MASESDSGEWEYLASEVGGRRCLTIMDKMPGWASPELHAAWALRREANLTGRCRCGAEFETVAPHQNRHARRAQAAQTRKTAPWPPRATAAMEAGATHVLMLHGACCPASDDSIRRLLRSAMN